MNACSCRLSQLHSVGYHRDVMIQDEREQRHNDQMRLLHQRGSGIVVDANYTLCKYRPLYLNETRCFCRLLIQSRVDVFGLLSYKNIGLET